MAKLVKFVMLCFCWINPLCTIANQAVDSILDKDTFSNDPESVYFQEIRLLSPVAATTHRPTLLPTAVISTIPDSELTALQDLYISTGGENWNWDEQAALGTIWNFSQPDPNPCLQSWQGVVCGCRSIQCHIADLHLSHYGLNGTLPNSLDQLTELNSLVLSINNISSTIPPQLGNLSKLIEIDLSTNQFTGVLPHSFQQLSELTTLEVANNRLSGKVNISSLHNLLFLVLYANNFTGEMLPQVISMNRLISLQIEHNSFSGTFPAALSINLQQLMYLDLGYNALLTGSIPIEVGQMYNLRRLFLGSCAFTGTLPLTLGNLSRMVELDLGDNLFTSTVPSTFASLNRLRSLIVSNNRLNGTFPANLNVSALYTVEIQSNLFTGDLSSVFKNHVRFAYFDCSSNFFYGSLPWRHWSLLTSFLADHNMFTGDVFIHAPLLVSVNISSNLLSGALNISHVCGRLRYLYADHNALNSIDLGNNATFLEVLQLNNNQIEGSLPEMIGNLSSLAQLQLQYNRFYGRVPTGLRQLIQLQILFLNSNLFTGGPLDRIVNVQAQKLLLNVDFSSNAFTGSLSKDLFYGANFASFAASQNCLTGSITTEICNVTTLTGLALGGLATAPSCRVALFPGSRLLTAFTLQQTIRGTIPPCLFSLPALQSLHIGGNGLTGSLPQDLVLTPGLSDVSVAYNVLRGPIPSAFQKQKWTSLDLSSNKFNGALSGDFANQDIQNSRIFVTDTRLSGNVPAALNAMQQISILDGNLFACDFSRRNIPQNDPKYEQYSCGSDVVNRSFYAWLIIVGALLCGGLLILFYVLRRQRLLLAKKASGGKDSEALEEGDTPSDVSNQQQLPVIALAKQPFIIMRKWRMVLMEESSSHLYSFSIFSHNIRLLFTVLAGIAVLILLPLYAGLSYSSGTYESEFAWMISPALLSGTLAGSLLCIFLAFVIVLLFFLFESRVFRQYRNWKQSVRRSTFRGLRLLSWGQLAGQLAAALVNFIVMIGVDILYVVFVLNSNTTEILLVQITLALFKVLWNEVVLWGKFPLLRKLVHKLSTRKPEEEEPSASPITEDDVPLLVITVLLNNIVLPLLAIAAVSSTCFYNALVAAPSVSSTYSYQTCGRDLILIRGRDRCIDVITATSQTTYNPPFIYSFQCSSTLLLNYIPVYVYYFLVVGFLLPVVKVLLYWIYQALDSTSRWSAELKYWISKLLIPPLFLVDQLLPSDGDLDPLSRPPILFNKLRLVVKINSYLALLMAFGMLFPPLAVLAAFSIFNVTVFEELALGRLIATVSELNSSDHGRRHQWVKKRAAQETADIALTFFDTIWLVTPFASLLYGYLVFDTIGDTNGWLVAMWPVLFLVALPPILGKAFLPIMTCCCGTAWMQRNKDNPSSDENGTGSNNAIELVGRAVSSLRLTRTLSTNFRSSESSSEVVVGRDKENRRTRSTQGEVDMDEDFAGEGSKSSLSFDIKNPMLIQQQKDTAEKTDG